MRSVLLFLLGVDLVCAEIHSLQYIYTAVSRDNNCPEFTAVGLLDGQEFMYFDSNIKKAVPKSEWIRQKEGDDYWDRQTQILTDTHQAFKNNIQVAKERFNQSTGVHTFQLMYGCELVDGTTQGFWQYGYDGEDFIIFDKNTLSWTAANPQAVTTKNKWDANTADAQYRKTYLENECIEWLKKYVRYGKDNLERKACPEVSLVQKDPSSPVVCKATGFYPNNIMMSWKKNYEDQHEDVWISSTLPNEDGTFQKSISLSVKREEWRRKPDVYRCVIQHVGAEEEIVVPLNEKNIKDHTAASLNIIAVVVGCLVGLAVAAIIGLIVWKKRSNGYVKGSNQDTDSENSDQPLPKT